MFWGGFFAPKPQTLNWEVGKGLRRTLGLAQSGASSLCRQVRLFNVSRPKLLGDAPSALPEEPQTCYFAGYCYKTPYKTSNLLFCKSWVLKPLPSCAQGMSARQLECCARLDRSGDLSVRRARRHDVFSQPPSMGTVAGFKDPKP